MILFVKNISIEGPETLGSFFVDRGFKARTIDLQSGDPLPDRLDGVQAVVVLGGPMNVYEEEKYPFLRGETGFIRQVVARQIPFLGICLGAQLLAKACGAKVTRSPQEEIGFFPVYLNDAGAQDPLFREMDREIEIFQWHGDMFAIPDGGRLLAASEGCPHQAFRIGPRAYGLQFHVEVTGKGIASWAEEYFSSGDPVAVGRKRAMLQDYQDKKEQFHQNADKIYENFLGIIRDR